MDSQFMQREVILVDRALADSVALSFDNPCIESGGIMSLAEMDNLRLEDLELIPVRLVCEDCADEASCRIRKVFAEMFWSYLVIIESLTLEDMLRSDAAAHQVLGA